MDNKSKIHYLKEYPFLSKIQDRFSKRIDDIVICNIDNLDLNQVGSSEIEYFDDEFITTERVFYVFSTGNFIPLAQDEFRWDIDGNKKLVKKGKSVAKYGGNLVVEALYYFSVRDDRIESKLKIRLWVKRWED